MIFRYNETLQGELDSERESLMGTVPEDKDGSSYLVLDKVKDLSKYEHMDVVETLGVESLND